MKLRARNTHLTGPASGSGSFRLSLIAPAFLALFSVASGAAHADDQAATLKQRVNEILEGKRPVAEVTIDVVGGRPDRRSLTVYGSGVGIWNREKQFTLKPGEHMELLKLLISSGLFEMPERPKPARSAEPSPNAPAIIRAVGVKVGDLERVVAQNDRVWTLPALEGLVTDLFKLCDRRAKKGMGAASLTDGLQKVASGKLAPETLLVVLNLPPVPAREPAGETNGVIATLDGGVLSWSEQASGKSSVDVRFPLSAERVRALAALLVETGFEKLPVNLYRTRYVDVRSAVLSQVQSVQARGFVGLDPAKHAAQQKLLERIIEAILALRPEGAGRATPVGTGQTNEKSERRPHVAGVRAFPARLAGDVSSLSGEVTAYALRGGTSLTPGLRLVMLPAIHEKEEWED